MSERASGKIAPHVILSAAKNLLFLAFEGILQILRCAQDDSKGSALQTVAC